MSPHSAQRSMTGKLGRAGPQPTVLPVCHKYGRLGSWLAIHKLRIIRTARFYQMLRWPHHWLSTWHSSIGLILITPEEENIVSYLQMWIFAQGPWAEWTFRKKDSTEGITNYRPQQVKVYIASPTRNWRPQELSWWKIITTLNTCFSLMDFHSKQPLLTSSCHKRMFLPFVGWACLTVLLLCACPELQFPTIPK